MSEILEGLDRERESTIKGHVHHRDVGKPAMWISVADYDAMAAIVRAVKMDLELGDISPGSNTSIAYQNFENKREKT